MALFSLGQGYRTTYVQFLIVAAIYFCASASYMVVNGVGGGGLVDSSVSARANFVSNIASSAVGLFSGAIHNYLGSRASLLIGAVAYVFFALSYFIYGLTGHAAIVYVAAVCFGLSITLFWTAQGSLMLSYPTEDHRGKYITTFFVAFSASGVTGGVLALALNFHSKFPTLGATTYLAAIAIGAVGVALVFFLRPASQLVQDNGHPLVVRKFEGWRHEIRGTGGIFTNKYMWLMTPLFIVLGTYFTYISNGYNFSLFTIRTRGLNATLFSICGMLGSLVFGYYMDHARLPMRLRGTVAAGAITVLLLASWVSAYFVQRPYPRLDPDSPAALAHVGHDFSSGFYWATVLIYCTWGFLDSTLNAFSFWILGGVTSDPDELARFTGYTRCLQGLGGVLSWGLDSLRVAYVTELWVTFSLLLVGMAFAVATIRVLPLPNETDSMDVASVNVAFDGDSACEEVKAPLVEKPHLPTGQAV
ncbi:hypothetical protein H4R33_006520 [Dimargaris cristalligena]|uniref:Major facilitator superfamily domain-containing protein n=1 Tax=Dimargaris cristalligena TaxID=215637 RepID=A0A4P9ZVB0_9FUNG|nr:hypothetical protein H4R33_006520 [Dimargaris cristalligena]RKP37556.1 major facilitator superfamily domain-containing protein [Dimargaris cristalligena]|eukprot:RKP37556.1 major facilitator superfamily domain-containing protein [Dimargaris cristalligena]